LVVYLCRYLTAKGPTSSALGPMGKATGNSTPRREWPLTLTAIFWWRTGETPEFRLVCLSHSLD
jgi:hypothetical protein